MVAADTLVPGLGFVVRAIQKTFGDQQQETPEERAARRAAAKADFDKLMQKYPKPKGLKDMPDDPSAGRIDFKSAGAVRKVKEDTSQSTWGTLYGYHKGFWSVQQGPNQPTVSIPTHQVYGYDGITKVVGKPGMRGKVVNTKKGPTFHSDDGGPVANPSGGQPLTIGVDYSTM
jgi:hypothetical protein